MMNKNEKELPQEISEQEIIHQANLDNLKWSAEEMDNFYGDYAKECIPFVGAVIDTLKGAHSYIVELAARIALSATPAPSGDLVERMETTIGNIRHELRGSHAPYAQDYEIAKACAALCPPQQTVSKYPLYEAVPVEDELPREDSRQIVIGQDIAFRPFSDWDLFDVDQGRFMMNGVTHWLRPVTTPTPDNAAVCPTSQGTGWQPISTAPVDTVVRVKVGEGMSFLAKRTDIGALNGYEEQCLSWVAEHDGEHPPCWTDGACWSVNSEDAMSLQPTHWMPLPEPPKGDDH